ncbi:MAG: hypothetical protein JNM93_14505 [Bacteriovoracaceae bacterium]|nr:hypothetical protein [Bacteriovoracaceae bacterium]
MLGFLLLLSQLHLGFTACDHHFSFLAPKQLYGLPFIQSKWSHDKFKRFQPFKDMAFLEQIQFPWMTQDALNGLSKKYKFKTKKNKTVTIYLELMHDPNIITKKLVKGKKQKVVKEHVTMLATLFMGDEIVGYTARNFTHDQFGNLVGDTEGMYINQELDEIRGIASSLFKFWYDEVYVKIPELLHVTNFADYVGRYLWAKLGYQFSETAWFWDIDHKSTIKLVDLARANLARFLERNKINPNDLSKPIEELQTPADFANLVHKKGKTIRMQPLIGSNKNDVILGPLDDFAIGKAFLLSDYRYNPKTDKYYVQGPMRGPNNDGGKISAYAMPKYRSYLLVNEN